MTLTSGMTATGSEEQTRGVPVSGGSSRVRMGKSQEVFGGNMESSEVCVERLKLWQDLV